MSKVLQLDSILPRQFIRGQHLDFIMELPQTIPAGWFADHVLSCQLRRLDNPDPSGLIADISVSWTDEQAIAVRFQHDDTSSWPVGLAEFDVVLTSPDGFRRRTLPVRIQIVAGVTQ